MQVKMLTVECGPRGNFQPGEVRDVPDEQGRQLIAGGFAAPVPQRETTAVAPREATVMPAAVTRKRSR